MTWTKPRPSSWSTTRTTRACSMGECFVKMDNERAEAKVEAMLTRERAALEALRGERKVLREGMEELKKVRLARSTRDGSTTDEI